MIFIMFTAFFASLGFAVIFDVSRSELVRCGIAGLTAEGVYRIMLYSCKDKYAAILIAAAAVTVLVRIMANLCRMPVTVYLISGIIPLVPGAAVYNAVYNIIASDYFTAANYAVDAAKAASAVAIGIALVFALPNKCFFRRRN